MPERASRVVRGMSAVFGGVEDVRERYADKRDAILGGRGERQISMF